MPTYDSYQELARIRAATNANLAFNAMQTGLLADLSGTMHAIDGEIAAVRQTQNQALAVQQQLLQQEVIQGQLEEFIFQAEKLVEQCSESDCELPPSTRYFLLKGVAEHVRQNGIGTPIIRGRDNKAAFERVLKSVDSITKKLKSDPEVTEAIAWAKQEQERVNTERRKLEAKKKKAQQDRQRQIQQLEVRYSTLQGQIKEYDIVTWYNEAVSPSVQRVCKPLTERGIPITVCHGVTCVAGWLFLPIGYFLVKQSKQEELNSMVLEEMREIEGQLNRVLADESVGGPVMGVTDASDQGGA